MHYTPLSDILQSSIESELSINALYNALTAPQKLELSNSCQQELVELAKNASKNWYVANTLAGGTFLKSDIEDVLRLIDLEARGSSDRSVSAFHHRLDYEDETPWIENWANLNAWNDEHLQVSANKLFSDFSASGNAAANRAFTLGAGERGRLRGTINLVDATDGSYVLIGLSKTTPDGAPNSDDMLAIGFDQATRKIVRWDAATPANLSVDAMPTGTYYVSVLVDENHISLVITNATHSLEYRYCRSRTGFDVNNAMIWNSDSRKLTGSSIGYVGAKAASATIYPRTNVEGGADSILWSYPDDTSTQRIRLSLPAAFDSRKPLPLCIYHIGSGEDAAAPFSDTLKTALIQTLTDAGYIVASTDAHGQNWGNQDGIDDYYALYQYARDHYPIESVVILSQSMGGLTGLLSLAERRIPNIVGWAGIYPVCNLLDMYGGSNKSLIQTAYGIVSDSEYAAKTEGHDPVLVHPYKFRGMPMRFYASPADTIVKKSENTDILAALVTGFVREATVIVCSGNHGDPSHFQPADLLAFFNRCIAA